MFAQQINKLLSKAGYVIKRTSRLPEHSWLGLKKLDFRTILDVGANIGQFGTTVRKEFPNARIYSIEPIPECFHILNATASRYHKWHAYNIALGETEGNLTMHVHKDNLPSSSFLASTDLETTLYPKSKDQCDITVECSSLDKFIVSEQIRIDEHAMLKLDVQGYEAHVLRGANESLKKVATVLTEINHVSFYEGQASFLDLATLLSEYGLFFHGVLEHSLSNEGRVIAVDALFCRNNEH